MSAPLLESSFVSLMPNQVSCDLAGEKAILHMESGVYYGLNPLGARIWEMIQTPKRVREIRDALLAEYAVDVDQCERDLFALLSELAEARLIQVRNETAA